MKDKLLNDPKSLESARLMEQAEAASNSLANMASAFYNGLREGNDDMPPHLIERLTEMYFSDLLKHIK